MINQIEVKKVFHPDKNAVRTRIYRQNVRLEGDDLTIEFPFHGQPAETDGKLKVRAHEDLTHPSDSVLRRKTIRCHYPQCPKDNILWTDYKNRVPYLEKNGELIPSGWWKLSVEHIEETVNELTDEINDELDLIRDGDGIKHGYKDRKSNDGIDGIISDYFPKGLPDKSKMKLHNVLWHMLTSLEGFRVYHMMLSPPQDHDYVSQKEYKKLKAKANRLLVKSGAWGAMVTMHHARVKDRFNDPISPSFKGFERRDDGEGFHFHAIAIGFFDYEEWKDSGWVIKNLSYDQATGKVIPVRSVRRTAAYLLEHCSIVSKKVGSSLSCQTTVLTTPNPDHSNYPISYISERVFSENPTSQKTNEIKDFPISIVSGNSEITEKSHIRKLRNYNAYWFIGALKGIKLPKKPTKCALTDHEIKKNTEVRVVLHGSQEVMVDLSYLKVLEGLKEIDLIDPNEIDRDIEKLKAGKLKMSIIGPIDPVEYEKLPHLEKIPTGIDRVLDDEPNESDMHSYFSPHGREWGSSKDFGEIKESCYRFRLSDPNYAWFKLPHAYYYTDILNEDASPEKIRMEILWQSHRHSP